MHPAIAAIKTAFIKKGDDLSFSFPMVIKIKEIASRKKPAISFFFVLAPAARQKVNVAVIRFRVFDLSIQRE
jgi:hypothetical protein